MHTWTFDENARIIRAYCWLWKASKDDIDFCKLFWGTLFSPFALIAHPIAFIFAPPAKRLGYWIDALEAAHKAKLPQQEAEEKLKRKAKEEKGPNGFQRALTNISSAFDRLASVAQNHEKGLQAFAVTTGVVVGLVALSVLGWLLSLVEDWPSVLEGLGFILAYVAGILIVVASMVFLIAVVIGEARWKKLGKAIKTTVHFFRDGIHSVKYRTCPQVIVKGN